MMTFFDSLRWQDFLDIAVVAFIIYRILILIRGTRARQLVIGFSVVFAAFYASRNLELFTLGWILNNFLGSIVVVIVVLFQDDIRRVLVSLGRNPLFRRITYVKETLFFDELVNACTSMGKRRTGALIVLEREVGLEDFMEIGVRLDAEVNAELIMGIFHQASPLHDGAMIIREGRIRAASCILPLTLEEGIGKGLGTRHRASVGITEVTDAVAVVVSEETGVVSYAYRGRIFTGVTGDTLRSVLRDLLE
jgi:diadenylate cyclase